MAEWKLDTRERYMLALIEDGRKLATIKWSDHRVGYEAHVEGSPYVRRFLDLMPAKVFCEVKSNAICED